VLDDEDELADKRICHACIGEPYLVAEVETSGVAGVCAYCGETDPSLTIRRCTMRMRLKSTQLFTPCAAIGANGTS
jgi:hypothetical protein